MALPNPSFEPKTHRWRPGVGAASQEVSSQNYTFCAPKQPFLAKTASKPSQNGQTKGRDEYTLCALITRDKKLFAAL